MRTKSLTSLRGAANSARPARRGSYRSQLSPGSPRSCCSMARSGTERQPSRVLIKRTLPSSTFVMAGTPTTSASSLSRLLTCLRRSLFNSSPIKPQIACGVVFRLTSEISSSYRVRCHSDRLGGRKCFSACDLYRQQATSLRLEANHVRRPSAAGRSLAKRLDQIRRKQIFHDIGDRGRAQPGGAYEIRPRAGTAFAQQLEECREHWCDAGPKAGQLEWVFSSLFSASICGSR